MLMIMMTVIMELCWAFSIQWPCEFDEITTERSIYYCSHFVVLHTQSPTASINRRKGAEVVRIQNPRFHLHMAHCQPRLSMSASSSGGGGTSACYPILHPSCVIMWLDFLSWNKCSRCQFNEKFCSMLPGLH